MISECNRANDRNRNVVQRRMVSMRQFWKQALGSFFISGDAVGMEEDRRRMLLSALQYSDKLARGTVVILHQDEELEAELIEMVRNGNLPRMLVVLSERYKNYHVFYGMNNMDIVHCIYKVGNYLKYNNISGVENYAEAFLQILKSMYEVSLPAMLSMAELDDQRIVELAQKQGVSKYWIQQLKKGSGSDSENFRLIIKKIYNVMEKITTRECETKFNMSQVAGQEQIICINTKSRDNGIMNICMGAELQGIKENRISVIIDNMSFCEEDGLVEVLNNFHKMEGNCLGICASDVNELWKHHELCGFETQVIFKHSYPEQLEQYLKKFGSYRHGEVMETQGPDDLTRFRLFLQKSWHIEYHDRLRVLPYEVDYAVLKGHKGEQLELVKYLTD